MSSNSFRLRLGTRGSPLALVQAKIVQHQVTAVHAWLEHDVQVITIRTSGDAIQDRALAEVGGKGLFTKELDTALLDQRIDFAVHSAKDLPTLMPAGIVIVGYLRREDPRDAFVACGSQRLADLPSGSVVGSASLRREAQIKRLRPDLIIRLLRGNVETRLKKIENGEFAATLLAMAGLNRLGLSGRATAILDLADFLPAVGQGAIALTARSNDGPVLQALAPVLDLDTNAAVTAERCFLAILDGSCRTPIAGHATIADGLLRLRGLVLRPDGSEAREISVEGETADAVQLGTEAGRKMVAQLPVGFLNR